MYKSVNLYITNKLNPQYFQSKNIENPEISHIYNYIDTLNDLPDLNWRQTGTEFTCDYNDIIITKITEPHMYGTFIVPKSVKGKYPKIVVLNYATLDGIIGDVTESLILNYGWYTTELTFNISGNIFITNNMHCNTQIFYASSAFFMLQNFYKCLTHNVTVNELDKLLHTHPRKQNQRSIYAYFVRIICPIEQQSKVTYIGIIVKFVQQYNDVAWRL